MNREVNINTTGNPTPTALTVVCAGLAGAIGYNLNAGILGGLGNSRTTLLFLAVSSVLNIVLDLALVPGGRRAGWPGWDTAG